MVVSRSCSGVVDLTRFGRHLSVGFRARSSDARWRCSSPGGGAVSRWAIRTTPIACQGHRRHPEFGAPALLLSTRRRRTGPITRVATPCRFQCHFNVVSQNDMTCPPKRHEMPRNTTPVVTRNDTSCHAPPPRCRCSLTGSTPCSRVPCRSVQSLDPPHRAASARPYPAPCTLSNSDQTSSDLTIQITTASLARPDVAVICQQPSRGNTKPLGTTSLLGPR